MAMRHLILASGAVPKAVMWTGVLIGLVVVLWIAWRSLRRRFVEEGADDGVAAPWTLQQLRDLKARGEISSAEYDALRGQMIAEAQGADGGGQVIGGYGDSQLEQDLSTDPSTNDSQPPLDDDPAAM